MLKKINKCFGKKPILVDINFTINKGDVIGFIGDNGAGKTTTIKILLGEFFANEGEILVDDHKISRSDYQKIAFFPDQNSFPKQITLKDYFNFYLSLKKINLDTAYRDLLLKEFGLADYLDKKITNLSSGMIKKMLMIAVLLADCELIIFDEPTANLDINSRNEFIEIFKYLKGKQKTILITTHLINDLEEVINKLIVIKQGRLVYDQPFASGNSIDQIYKATHKDNKESQILNFLK